MLVKRWWIFVAACVVTCAPGAVAWSQEEATPPTPMPAVAAEDYESIAIPAAIYKDRKPSSDTTVLETKTVNVILRGTMPLSQNEARFDAFFTRYYFPLMTSTDDYHLGRIPLLRRQLFSNYIRPPWNVPPEVHEHLVTLTFNSMQDLTTKNYHPATRYNAMLIIGDLNSKEMVTIGASAALPDPYAPARDFMVEQILDVNQIDAVRVAALLGLLRHAEMNALRPADRQLPAPARDSIVKRLLPLATTKTPPEGRAEEGHHWIRGRVIEVLTTYSQASLDNNVLKLLTTTIADKSEPLDLRFVAAVSLGKLNLASANGIVANDLARDVALVAIEGSRNLLTGIDAEITKQREKDKAMGIGPRRPIPGGVRDFGGLPRGPAAQKAEERILLARRILKDYMTKTADSLQGPEKATPTGAASAAKTAAHKTYVNGLLKAVGDLSKVADKAAGAPEPLIEQLAKDMRLKITALEAAAKVGGPAAPPMPMTEEVPGAEVPGAEVPGAEIPAEAPAVAPPPAAPVPKADEGVEAPM